MFCVKTNFRSDELIFFKYLHRFTYICGCLYKERYNTQIWAYWPPMNQSLETSWSNKNHLYCHNNLYKLNIYTNNLTYIVVDNVSLHWCFLAVRIQYIESRRRIVLKLWRSSFTAIWQMYLLLRTNCIRNVYALHLCKLLFF